MGLEINNNNTAVIVGKSRDKYAVCFGDNYIYLLSVGSLSRYTVINTNIADIPDLSGMFGEPSVEFLNHLANKQSTSLGVTRKFFGKSKYGYCILKFSKYPDTCVYLDNEVFCYKIALILGVSCCRAFRTKYSGRDCVLSVFEYNVDIDTYRSFRQTGLPVSGILNTLSKTDRAMFVRYLIFDFLTRQQDRHLSNLALINDRLYPLFDNGDCFGTGFVSEQSKIFRDAVLRLSAEDVHKALPVTAKQLKDVEDVLSASPERAEMFMTNFKECYNR
jgi:hypothetical protein